MKPSFATDAHPSVPVSIGRGAEKNTVLHVFHQPVKAPNAFSINIHTYLFGVPGNALNDVLSRDIGA